MIADSRIDVVTVAVKAPAHKPLVLAALKAGKAVCSEFRRHDPGRDRGDASASRGLHTAIGLRGRHNPSVRRAAELVATGRLGRILSARVGATTVCHAPSRIRA